MPESILSLEKAAIGILALLTADHDGRIAVGETGKRAEIVLADAGFTIPEIVQVTGRKYETVKTSLRRARSKSESVHPTLEEQVDGSA